MNKKSQSYEPPLNVPHSFSSDGMTTPLLPQYPFTLILPLIVYPICCPFSKATDLFLYLYTHQAHTQLLLLYNLIFIY